MVARFTAPQGGMMHRIAILALISLATLGCSGSPPPAPDDLGTYPTGDLAMPPAIDMTLPERDPTDHPPAVQMSNGGDPTLANMELWTVVWKGDEELGQRINRFAGWMLQSDYWTSSLEEYGIGAGKAMGVIVLPDAVPTSFGDTPTARLIQAHVADGLFPKPNVNTVFSFIPPKNITWDGGDPCQQYLGYHTYAAVARNSKEYVPHAINFQCIEPGQPAFDTLTFTLSHEAGETASDPYQNSWGTDNNLSRVAISEIGDLCNDIGIQYTVTSEIPDGGVVEDHYLVTRFYSAKNAAAGNADPCVPTPAGRPYFNSGLLPNESTLTRSSATKSGSVDVMLEPFAFGDVGLIKWETFLQGSGVTITPSSGLAHAGDTIRLTITADKTAQPTVYLIPILSQAQKGGENEWWGTVTVQ
jgi:hypothetical protein